jgi:hypothetical protein
VSDEGLARGATEQVASALVGVVAFAGYALACAPTPYLLDSGELAAAAFGLGIAHPPGEPLAALWGKLFSLLPVGSVAFRVGLGQAVAGALAAVLLFRLALAVWAPVRRPGEHGLLAIAVAAAVAWGFAFAPGVIIVADRPEVYALETALALGALLAAVRALDGARGDQAPDPRPLLVAAGLIGLGLATHPLVGGLAGAGAALAALPWLRGPGRLRLIAFSVLALAAGALVLVYLPVRAAALFAAGPPDTIAWGDARTPGGLRWLLTAATFTAKAKVVHTAAASPTTLPFFFMEELEPAMALLAPVGAVLLLRRRPGRLAAVCVLVGGAGSIAAALIGGLDPANPDVRGYLGVAIAVGALLAGAAVVAGLGAVKRGPPWLPAALAALLAAGALTRFPSPGAYPGLRRSAAADVAVGRMLGELPPRAALFTSHIESAFVVGYQRLVEGRRPDVAWAHLGFVRGPGYVGRLTAAEPDLAPALAVHLAGPLSFSAVLALERTRPVRLEVDEHLAPALRGRLTPAGLTWRLDGLPWDHQPVTLTSPPAWMLEEAAADRQVRGYLAWRAYNDAALACSVGQRDAARFELGLLAALLPRDGRLAALRARCPAGAP